MASLDLLLALDASATLPRPRQDVDGLARRTQALLAAGIPLSLLLDLADPGGPQSEELYALEG